MPDFILTRSGEIPAKITGELVGSTASRNADFPGKESSNRQWFELDVYKTVAGKFLAHVKYRAGSKIAREEPCDRLFVPDSGESLPDVLNSVDPVEQFVVGWPGDGSPEENNGRDFTAQDASVCRFAQSEWDNLLEKSQHLFGVAEEIA